MKTTIIIHGHFYQPPRENPYTGIIPNQVSAKPSANWNEAIYKTCYKPNAASRYLTPDRRIDRIYNNYIRISSNMGQTLLDWMDQAHPKFMQKLLFAERESVKRFGHSSFMAQGFNHTIMPLDSDSTKNIQTEWAIESYRQRFGHDPEGIWLAECAIDPATVDVLAQHGIKFVVLAPWQAVAIDGKPTNGKSMPCDRPFIIRGKKHSISAFFYDPEFASGISFGHMLRDADAMFARLKEMRKERDNPALISWATDGEIYGHHEPFGDMGLAAFIRKIEESKDFEIDNFGSYLEKHPATEVATLGGGDDGKGTSWSCMHGVGRWERDCGCHTGGDDKWNQKWRGPLRTAFRNLEASTRKIMDSKVQEILGEGSDYEKLILDFKAVVSHRQTVLEFVNDIRKKDGTRLDKDQAVQIATLLEAFKNVMFSFTSCGFFFNDLAGIEPRQDIAYAVYASKLLDSMCGTSLHKKLISDLSYAKSNILTEGTGADIAKKDAPKGQAYANACAYFFMNRQFADPVDYVSEYGIYELLQVQDQDYTLRNSRTLRIHNLHCESTPEPNGALTFTVTDKDNRTVIRTNVAAASSSTLEVVASWIEKKLTAGVSEGYIDTLAANIGNYLVLLSSDRSLAKETIFTENIGTCIKVIKSLILDQPNMDFDKKIERIRQLSFFVKIKGRPLDIQDITDAFSTKFRRYADAFNIAFDEKLAIETLRMLRTAREEGFNPDITNLQDAVYRFIGYAGFDSDSIPAELRADLINDLNFV